jgi:sulfatase maturation enzyme AslB (radical SAM superfamily)
MALRPNGKIMPCCVYQNVDNELPDSLNSSHPDPFNHPYMVELRERMTRNERIPGCVKCYTDERITGNSFRKDANSAGWNFGIPEDDTRGTPVLTNIDMTFSNVCNNKCRMCMPELSTHWYSDAKKLGMPIPTGVIARNSIIEDSDVSSLRYLKILGGEPLMEADKLKKFLHKCNRSQLGILFVTNCTLLPDEELYDLLQECKFVNINLSIDAYGKLNDFLRKDSAWETVNHNLHWYYENFEKVSVHSVISIYNATRVHELIDHVNSVGDDIYHDCVLLTSPYYMRVCNLTDSAKQYLQNYVKESIVTYPNNAKIFKLLAHEIEQTGNFREFVKLDKQMNELRNEHWREHNPELWNIIAEEYNNE